MVPRPQGRIKPSSYKLREVLVFSGLGLLDQTAYYKGGLSNHCGILTFCCWHKHKQTKTNKQTNKQTNTHTHTPARARTHTHTHQFPPSSIAFRIVKCGSYNRFTKAQNPRTLKRRASEGIYQGPVPPIREAWLENSWKRFGAASPC